MEPESDPDRREGTSPTRHCRVDESAFAHVPRAPEIPVYAVMIACSKDPSPVKLNLGMGVYRTEDGRPLLLNVVKKAEELLFSDPFANKEYLPITGLAEFRELSAKLIFGTDSPAIKENRVTTVQCLSGSGSLRIAADFLAKYYYQVNVGLCLRTYRYYDPVTKGLDFQGILEDLASAPSGAIVLLHACAHNPTGVDPTVEQWEDIRQIIRSKGLLPFFDCAYQGFVSGSLEDDARAVRKFVADGGECLVVQSYSKNMGLYGERVGALSVVCKTADVATRIESQLKLLIRPMYSNPPIHGAAIAAAILKDRNLFNEWTLELETMTKRLIHMREQLFDALHERGTPGDWTHILKHVGLFTFSGLKEEQIAFMTREFHIYMSSDGRINMAGLSTNTVPHLANAIHAAVTQIP
ncbi:hypothetical protein BT93_L4232 [Corymbia citriodora subsp. variegata]|uniref:Aspartate aminotransferase n=1 Tax=Corymbia citriodora subsp. variegata TaxID=360336 RepID=A0A8T0CX23_CORYI|nr:hypothetical protein BT93_L4232 [Corymbia citriodora subsp. variegata]